MHWNKNEIQQLTFSNAYWHKDNEDNRFFYFYGMKYVSILALFILFNISCDNKSKPKRKTIVTISENQFLINGELTYKGRYWKGNKIEGLLLIPEWFKDF